MPPDLRLWPDAVREAAQRWYPEAKATIEELSALGPKLSPAMVEEKAGDVGWLTNTVKQLLGHLCAGELVAYYLSDAFGSFGWLKVQREFWSSPYAEDALWSGWYWPFGRRQRQPSYQLYLVRSEFDALISPVPSAPKVMSVPEIVAFLHDHPDKTRKEQWRLICEQYPDRHIPRRRWRQALKKASPPRDSGRRRTPEGE
jgi:hypothetical protein